MNGQHEMIITHTHVSHQPEAWPAKNRQSTALPPPVIQIVSGDGTEEFDPVGLLNQMQDRRRDFLPLPNERSELSGEPAIIYRSDDLELRLSPPELRRMAVFDLQDAEFCALRDRYGMAREWHEYIYDPVTGTRRRPEDEATLRGRWLMDGATTLTEAAQKLRAFADALVWLEEHGWELDCPVEDDYVCIFSKGTATAVTRE